MPSFLRRLWFLLRHDRMTAELEEEMRFHVAERERTLRESGATADAARVAARRRFGNRTAIAERSQDAWGFGGAEQLARDVRHAARRLRKRPAFSASVIAVLALGIGATTAVFSAVDAVLLRPLPLAEPDRLVVLPNIQIPFQPALEMPGRREGLAPSITQAAAMGHLFGGVAAYAAGGLNLDDPASPERVRVGVVTTSFFATLGVRTVRGRTFAAEEGVPDGPRVVVLSHALATRRFGDADPVGRSIPLNGKAYTVVGVMPRGFAFPRESDLWIPLSVPTTFASFEAFRGWLPSTVVARLAPGVARDDAAKQLLAVWETRAARQPADEQAATDESLRELRAEGAVKPLRTHLVGDRSRALLILLGATGLLLLIACANVANLLLSDAAARRREIAVREVLGASRRRIVRQLLVESLLLALTGAIVGLLLAPAALGVLRAMLPASFAGLATAAVDLRVLAFAVGLAVLTALVFGLWPALGATRGDASATIKSGGGHGATGAHVGFVRRALVTAELALAVMLLIGAGVMFRSFQEVMAQEMGMDPSRVAAAELTIVREQGAAAGVRRRQFVADVLARLRATPGVSAAGVVNDLPLRNGTGGGIAIGVSADGMPTPREEKFARYLVAGGDYFAAMGIPLLRGRAFTAADADSAAPPVAVISKGMADHYWPGVDPIGRTFAMRPDKVTVVGVVADVREAGLEKVPEPQMYLSMKHGPTNLAIVVRGTLPDAALLASLREAVRAVDPKQPVYNARMMTEVIGIAAAARRTNTILIGAFALVGLLLAALGVYAVVSYGVGQRTREFGIRQALGAEGGDLVRLVSREMVAVVAAGIVLGLGGAWMLARVLESVVYGVAARDPVTFVVVPLVLLVPAALATLVPASRALSVSPAAVMRAE